MSALPDLFEEAVREVFDWLRPHDGYGKGYKTRPRRACGAGVRVSSSDASEFGWFLYGPGRGGRWFVLGGEP